MFKNISNQIFTDFENTDIQLYPNPTNGWFYISSGSTDIEVVQVTDILGKTVYLDENISNTQTEIDLSRNENGIYLISVFGKENQVFNSKVLLNR